MNMDRIAGVEMAEDERDLLRCAEQAFAEAFSNPNREGRPARNLLGDLRPIGDPAGEHLVECSSSFVELQILMLSVRGHTEKTSANEFKGGEGNVLRYLQCAFRKLKRRLV